MKRSTFENILNPYIQNTANLLSRHFMQKGEEERKRKEMLKAEQEQQGIMSQITRGSINPPKLVNGKFEPQGVSYPNAGDFNLRAGLTADNRNLMKYWDELNAPKEIKKAEIFTDANGNKRKYKFDPQSNSLIPDMSNEGIISAKEETPKARWSGLIEPEGDKAKKMIGYENPNADPNDPTTRNVEGKLWTITDFQVLDFYEKVTNPNNPNDIYIKMSKGLKSSLDEFSKEQRNLNSIVESGFGNSITKSEDGVEMTYRKKLNTHNKIFSTAIDNSMSPSAMNWYKEEYNKVSVDKIRGNPHPENYYDRLKLAFIRGDLGKIAGKADEYEVFDFEILIEKGRAIYGYVPPELESLREQYK